MAAASLRIRDVSRVPIEVFTDPIFFHKSQIKVGTVLRHLGRKNPNTIWIVERIWSLRHTQHGWVKSSVAMTIKLDDLLDLRCEQTNEVRTLRFSYMSYSAIWRLA